MRLPAPRPRRRHRPPKPSPGPVSGGKRPPSGWTKGGQIGFQVVVSFNGDTHTMKLGRPPVNFMHGRRLTPSEVARLAAEMGLPVSGFRYAPETTDARNRRAVAYAQAIDDARKIKPHGVPGHIVADSKKRPWHRSGKKA